MLSFETGFLLYSFRVYILRPGTWYTSTMYQRRYILYRIIYLYSVCFVRVVNFEMTIFIPQIVITKYASQYYCRGSRIQSPSREGIFSTRAPINGDAKSQTDLYIIFLYVYN